MRHDAGEAEVLRLLEAYHGAMVAARTDALDALLDCGFALVHLTGYVQPKDEWFDVICSGEFDYHRIDVDARSLSVRVTRDGAVADGRGIFDATIRGMRRPWRLQFTMQLEKRADPKTGDRWIVRHARYTTY